MRCGTYLMKSALFEEPNAEMLFVAPYDEIPSLASSPHHHHELTSSPLVWGQLPRSAALLTEHQIEKVNHTPVAYRKTSLSYKQLTSIFPVSTMACAVVHHCSSANELSEKVIFAAVIHSFSHLQHPSSSCHSHSLLLCKKLKG